MQHVHLMLCSLQQLLMLKWLLCAPHPPTSHWTVGVSVDCVFFFEQVLSHCPSTRCVSTATQSEDGNLIYTGSLGSAVRGEFLSHVHPKENHLIIIKTVNMNERIWTHPLWSTHKMAWYQELLQWYDECHLQHCSVNEFVNQKQIKRSMRSPPSSAWGVLCWNAVRKMKFNGAISSIL